MHYDVLHVYSGLHGSAAFDTLQVRIPHITVYYICRHELFRVVTVFHLITPQ